MDSEIIKSKIQKSALRGLTLKQKRTVIEIGNPENKTLAQISRKIGDSYRSRQNIYTAIKNPKLKNAISQYYCNGELQFLDDLSRGRISMILQDCNSADSTAITAARTVFELGGKLKRVNINQNITVSVDMDVDKLSQFLSGDVGG